LLELMVVITIIAMLLSLLIPAVTGARASARRLQCANNLHNVSLALIQNTDAHDRFPANGNFGTDGTQYFSWVVSVLPFLERRDIAEKWAYDKAWVDPDNLQLGSLRLSVLLCPDDPSALLSGGYLSYLVNSGIGWPNARGGHSCPMAFHRTLGPTLMEPLDLNGNGLTGKSDLKSETEPTDIALMMEMGLFFVENWPLGSGLIRHHSPGSVVDGLSNTLMLSESIHAGYDPSMGNNWSTPFPRYNSFIFSAYVCKDATAAAGNVNYARANDKSQEPYRMEAVNGDREQPAGQAPWASSFHPAGVHVAFCDGRIQFMSDSIDGGVYAALMSPQGTLIQGPLAQPGPDADDYLR
jgi:hypothetical protein